MKHILSIIALLLTFGFTAGSARKDAYALIPGDVRVTVYQFSYGADERVCKIDTIYYDSLCYPPAIDAINDCLKYYPLLRGNDTVVRYEHVSKLWDCTSVLFCGNDTILNSCRLGRDSSGQLKKKSVTRIQSKNLIQRFPSWSETELSAQEKFYDYLRSARLDSLLYLISINEGRPNAWSSISRVIVTNSKVSECTIILFLSPYRWSLTPVASHSEKNN
ncbi:MAG: hypothetical protein NC418_07340 [Muribaculaceae bacterium]|nr:hypothetical protein [Muribaculaceae bacterium]